MDGDTPCEAKPHWVRCERVFKISMDGKFWIVKTRDAPCVAKVGLSDRERFKPPPRMEGGDY